MTIFWKSKLLEIKSTVAELKSGLLYSLCRLRDKENRNKESCRCIGFCVITHTKHNWEKSPSEEIMFKLRQLNNEHVEENINCGDQEKDELSGDTGVNNKIHECESCTESFSTPDAFIFHMEHNHKEAAVTFLG